jgi:DNA-binding Lrp family transcriptional regulator
VLAEADLVLVHALQEAPRAPWSQLARALATDPRSLVRRYERLTEAGYLRVMATAGPELLKRLALAHVRVRAAPGRARILAQCLARCPQVTTIRLTDGSYDLHALLLGVHQNAVAAQAHELLESLPGVEHLQVNTVLEIADAGRAARLDSLSRRQVSMLRGNAGPQRRATRPRLSLDDLRLIRLLLHDGRMANTELAARLGQEPSVVSRRLGRLLRDGLVDIVALIPDSASSAPARALLWCVVAPDDLPPMLYRAGTLPWLGLMTINTGQANLLAVANLQTPAQLNQIQGQLLTMCPSLRLAESQLSIQAVKVHAQLLTDDDCWSGELTDPLWDLREDLIDVAPE